MLREIRVYGQLAKFLGRRKFMAAVDSAAEAVRFLLANFPQLERHMIDQHYRVSVGSYDLGENELHDPAGQQVIKITPVIVGAGGRGMGIGAIIAGVALIAASIFIPGSTALLGTTFGKLSLAVGLTGASLALYGVAQVLSPTPRASALNTVGGINAGFGGGFGGGGGGGSDPRDSYSFNGVQNVSRQGVPVPIIFGEVICGSVTVSAAIDVAQKKG